MKILKKIGRIALLIMIGLIGGMGGPLNEKNHPNKVV